MIGGLIKAVVVAKNIVVGGIDLLLLYGDDYLRSSHENSDDDRRLGETQYDYETRVGYGSSWDDDDDLRARQAQQAEEAEQARQQQLMWEELSYDDDDKSKF